MVFLMRWVELVLVWGFGIGFVVVLFVDGEVLCVVVFD